MMLSTLQFNVKKHNDYIRQSSHYFELQIFSFVTMLPSVNESTTMIDKIHLYQQPNYITNEQITVKLSILTTNIICNGCLQYFGNYLCAFYFSYLQYCIFRYCQRHCVYKHDYAIGKYLFMMLVYKYYYTGTRYTIQLESQSSWNNVFRRRQSVCIIVVSFSYCNTLYALTMYVY